MQPMQPSEPNSSDEDLAKKALENSNQVAEKDLGNPNYNIAAMDPDEWAWRKDGFWCG